MITCELKSRYRRRVIPSRMMPARTHRVEGAFT
jgi:hypothetical protein